MKAKVTDPAPFYKPERDGVTASLLGAFLDCREKARLHLQGWSTQSASLAITFGNVVHYMNQRVYDDVRRKALAEVPGPKYFRKLSADVETIWKEENPRPDAKAVEHFELTMLLVEAMMPLYFKHWYRDDFHRIEWESLEMEFRVPFVVRTPQGKTFKTFLRGKMDGLYREGTKRKLRLFETKTKARVEEENIADILPFERQVNLYMVGIRKRGDTPSGVLYNIIRRPMLRQRKSETLQQFAERIIEDVKYNLNWYFVRMQMDVSVQDLNRGEEELNELVSDFVLWWNGALGHYKNTNHCENKYGTCPFLRVCSSGEYHGLFKRTKVFSELEEM